MTKIARKLEVGDRLSLTGHAIAQVIVVRDEVDVTLDTGRFKRFRADQPVHLQS